MNESMEQPCPTCGGIRTVVDAGDGEGVFWFHVCRGFFPEAGLRSRRQTGSRIAQAPLGLPFARAPHPCIVGRWFDRAKE
jgi:hypothetical protein